MVKKVKPALAKKTGPAPHAESMMTYAEDAKNNPEPWLLWEWRANKKGDWAPMTGHPVWEPEYEYRRIQPRGIVNGMEVALGVNIKPNENQEFFIPQVLRTEPDDLTDRADWEGPGPGADDDEDDYEQLAWFKAGLIYLNREDAHARALAMLDVQPLPKK